MFIMNPAWNPCPDWGTALLLAGACVLVTLAGTVARTARLLDRYYVQGDWPGMVHHSERGPGTLCGHCGHHLTAHDRATGRCCHSLPLDRLAAIITLPMPLPLRGLVQRAGCPCRIGHRRT